MIEHIPHIRRCYQLADEAVASGNHPFGALLMLDGEVIATARNDAVMSRNPTRHAEMACSRLRCHSCLPITARVWSCIQALSRASCARRRSTGPGSRLWCTVARRRPLHVQPAMTFWRRVMTSSLEDSATLLLSGRFSKKRDWPSISPIGDVSRRYPREVRSNSRRRAARAHNEIRAW